MRGKNLAIADRATLVRNDETPLVPQYLSALVPFRRAAFTLAEMMVVMLIASIILACMAPAITTRIKMDQNSTQNLSPWKWTADGLGDAFFSNEDNATAMIGQNQKAATDSAKLIINNSTGLADMILFKNGANVLGHLQMSGNGLVLGSGEVTAGNSIAIGQLVEAGRGNYAIGTLINLGTGTNNIAIGDRPIQGSTSNTNSGSGNVAIGGQTLNSNISGNGNIAIGTRSSLNNNSGYDNIALGFEAMRDNETGDNNIALGYQAMAQAKAAESGTYNNRNIAIGHQALFKNYSSSNIAIGHSAMSQNTKGYFNVAIGADAMNQNTTAASNTAIGYSALKSNTTGSSNVAIGAYALENQTSTTVSGTDVIPSDNVAIGPYALRGNKASGNVAIGRGALVSNGYGEGNVAVGAEALKALSGNNADYNTAVGSGALAGVSIHANNVAVGYHALNQEMSGGNTAVGSYALAGGTYNSSSDTVTSITSGRKNGMLNTAVGYLAMVSNNGGQNDVAVGYKALSNNSTGNYNVAIGDEALNSNTTGGQNTAIGYQALYENSAGNYNVAVGEYACKYVKGSNKTCIGKGSGPASGDTLAAADNEERVIFLGDSNTTVYIPGKLRVDGNVELAVNTDSRIKTRSVGRAHGTNLFGVMERDDLDLRTYTESSSELPSDRRLKNVGKEFASGLDKIRQLKVFNYTYKDDKEKTPRVGVIAQDLQKIFPNAVKKGADGFLRIRMEDMFYAVINAIKELDAKYQAQEKRINELEKRIEKLEARMK